MAIGHSLVRHGRERETSGCVNFNLNFHVESVTSGVTYFRCEFELCFRLYVAQIQIHLQFALLLTVTMASLAAAAPPAAAAHSLSANRMDAESESEVIEVDDDDDDDENIDEEQLEEYKEMVEQLGSFPVRSSSSNAAWQPIQARSEGLSHLNFLAFCIASRTH
jgi:hypothetical protein